VSDLVDQMSQLNQTVSNMILQGLSQMISGGVSEAPASRRRKRGHDRECEEHDECDECRDCERDDCYCRCCIGDADLVVYARLFEIRVVPITLVNDRRREKKIKLELSEFKTRGGDTLGVKGVIVPPLEFTLPPCGEQQIILLIETVPEGQTRLATTTAAAATTPDQRIKDVDECKVLYADLRVEGCDIRPVRIALALLPRDCEDLEIHCGCTCC
jgi:hypothetical protein